MKLFFEPLDVLFFRDSRPFMAGENFAGRSYPMPLPSVFYGALRTKLLQGYCGIRPSYYRNGQPQHRCQATEVVGGPDAPGSLCLKGPFLAARTARGVQELFPMPLELGKSSEGALQSRQPLGTSLGFTGLGLMPLWWKMDKPPEAARGYLTLGEMKAYLHSRAIPGWQGWRDKQPVEREERIGIGLEAGKRAAQEGRIYAAQFLRLREGYGFAVYIDGLNGLEPQGDFMALGGEGRVVRLERIEAAVPDMGGPPKSLVECGRFKLYLATPALFTQGWLPSWLDSQTFTGKWNTGIRNSLRLRLVAAAVGRPIHMSGFDMARRQPKPIRRAVPAGTVYFFQLEDGDPQLAYRAFHFQSISEISPEAGFGVTFVGGWDYV